MRPVTEDWRRTLALLVLRRRFDDPHGWAHLGRHAPNQVLGVPEPLCQSCGTPWPCPALNPDLSADDPLTQDRKDDECL